MSGQPRESTVAPSVDAASWGDANRRYLLAAVDVVRAHVERLVVARDEDRLQDRRIKAADALATAFEAVPGRPSLDRLVSLFGLSPFERALILLGVGMETSVSFGRLCAAAQPDTRRPFPGLRPP